MYIAENQTIMEKLKILSDAAKYDVACTSSGTSRGNDGQGIGSCVQMGVVLKRALYFLTCNGRMMYPVKMEQDSIARNLLDGKEKLPAEVQGMTYRQLSLFDDVRFGGGINEKNLCV